MDRTDRVLGIVSGFALAAALIAGAALLWMIYA
jgi:hypothetical protein